MKTIIAGSREGAISADVSRGVRELEKRTGKQVTEVVCGMARGADALGKQWAERRSIPVKEMPANWKPNGPDGPTDKAAGHKRNRAMGDYAEALVAIWDGKSPGTKGMIDYMNRLKKPVVIAYVGSSFIDFVRPIDNPTRVRHRSL